MSNPATKIVERAVEDALDDAFDKVYGHIESGFCTAEEATQAVNQVWGDDVADVWEDYMAEMGS